MKKLIRILACLVLALTCVGCIHKQMLLVTQYPEGSERVAAIADTIESTIKGQSYSCNLVVFNMNTVSHPTEIWREQMGRMAVVRAHSLDPDVVFVAGDDAARYFAQRLAGTRRRFIFLDLKGDPADYGFTKSLTVTGVREVLPVKEAVAMMKRLVPSASGVAVLADKSLEGDAVVSQIEKATGLQIPIVAVKRARTLAEWVAAVAELQDKADVLCIASYRSVVTDEKGRNAIAPADLLKMTAEANRLPDFSFWPDAVGADGVMAAVTVPIEAQAEIAAQKAIRVMYFDEDISRVRIAGCKAHATVVSRERASQLGISVPDDL